MNEPAIFDRLQVVTGRDVLRPLRSLHEANEQIHTLKREAARIRGELAGYRAQFFGFENSNYNHERKVLLAQMAEARRQELIDEDQKVTEGYLKNYAKSHPAYTSWLANQHERRERMYQLEAELAQVEADIEGLEGKRQVALKAAELMKAAIYFAGQELKMD